jgi:hypothetical protein
MDDLQDQVEKAESEKKRAMRSGEYGKPQALRVGQMTFDLKEADENAKKLEEERADEATDALVQKIVQEPVKKMREERARKEEAADIKKREKLHDELREKGRAMLKEAEQVRKGEESGLRKETGKGRRQSLDDYYDLTTDAESTDDDTIQ